MMTTPVAEWRKFAVMAEGGFHTNSRHCAPVVVGEGSAVCLPRRIGERCRVVSQKGIMRDGKVTG